MSVRERLVCVGLVVLVIAVYAQTASFGYVTFDDDLYVASNPVVRAGLTRAGLAWAFGQTHLGFWIPATWLSLMVDCQLFGGSAGASHLVNAALHATNAVLVFAVLRRMTGALWPSAFVAALFAVHPLHVESVAWVTERKDVLSTLFWLLAAWANARAAEVPSTRRRAAVSVFAALAVMAKPMAVTLPVTLLLLDYWPLGRLRLRPLSVLLYEKAPLFAISIASAAVTALSHGREGAAKSLDQFPLALRLENAVVSYAAYLVKAAWPVDLAVFYPYPAHVPLWQIFASTLLLAGVTIVAIEQRRRRPYLLAGWLWYLVTLVPVIGFVQAGEQAMADRFTYVPLLGIFVMIAWGAKDLLEARPSWRPAAAAAAVVVVVALAGAAWRQTRTWRDGETLFSHALSATRDNALARHNLARALSDEGRLDEAIANYETATRLDPNRVVTRIALGAALQRAGRRDEARLQYEEALRADPESPGAHNNLGLLLASDAPEAARAHYERALRTDPQNVDALTNLATLLASEGHKDEAEALLVRALRIDPFDEAARHNLDAIRGR